jgi:hypothetical protein
MIKVDFDQSEIDAINGVMKRIEKRGKMFGNQLILKTADIFIKSAAVATPPGRAGFVGENKKGIPEKSKKRKVVTISAKAQKSSGYVHYYDLRTGNTFKRPKSKPLTAKEADSKNLVLVTKFVEYINTKNGKKFYKPMPPTQEAKTSKLRHIPTAGSAKLGWIGAARKLRGKIRGGKSVNKSSSFKGVNKGVNTTIHKKGWNPFIFIQNNVDYMTKVAPMSARRGLRNATLIMEKRYLKEEERFFTEQFRKKRISHMMRYGVKI